MTPPRYFIWRLTDREPWRVRRVGKAYTPIYPGFCGGRSNDYQAALNECKRLNAERKGGGG